MRLLLLVSLLIAGCVSAPGAPSAILVRHAETEGTGPDRDLSAAGRARAERLAELLASSGATRVLTTDYRRTRATAAPIAARLGVAVEIYDPRDLASVARLLESRRETVVVVGHSNTTPELVALLGGDPGAPMTEADYDRLYRVALGSGRTRLEHVSP